jgi:hypothetical protein
MLLVHTIYDDGVIATALVRTDSGSTLLHLAMRWLPPEPVRKNESEVSTTNLMGGETSWFVLPHSFAVPVARFLVERRALNAHGFVDQGFAAMIAWLLENEAVFDGMCY